MQTLCSLAILLLIFISCTSICGEVTFMLGGFYSSGQPCIGLCPGFPVLFIFLWI